MISKYTKTGRKGTTFFAYMQEEKYFCEIICVFRFFFVILHAFFGNRTS